MLCGACCVLVVVWWSLCGGGWLLLVVRCVKFSYIVECCSLFVVCLLVGGCAVVVCVCAC